MLTLTANDVRLGATAADWQDALNQAARDLEAAGRTSPDYLSLIPICRCRRAH